MQKECNFCDNHQQINLEKNDATGKWVATNLDGSIHKHIKYNAQPKQETVTITETVARPIVTREEAADIRSEAIAKAHDENMQANQNLIESINQLANAILDNRQELRDINANIRILTNTIMAYIESTGK
jgi:hypothetical protein